MRFFKKAKKNEGWLSVSIAADGVRAARLSRPGDAKPIVELATFVATPLPLTPAGLEKIGKDLQINAYQCSAVLGGGEYQIVSVEAPNVPPEELKTAVRWRLKDMLDFHIDDATIDVADIPVDKSATVRTHNMFAVAARNSVIEARQNLFAQAKVGLTAIDIPEMAQRNVSSLLEAQGRGLAMLSFAADGGLLTVTYAGELYLARRIDVTLMQLMESDYDKKHASFDKITLELQRSLDHFDRQYHFINVSKMMLAPTGASGLEEYLSSNLYTPVETLNLNTVFDLAKVPELQDVAQQQRFFLTLGAALREEEVAL